MLRSLPVLMYHYISRVHDSIAVHPDQFEDHCRGMAAEGWRGVSLAEAEAFLAEGAPLPDRSVLITFDDGFLDNYVHALPILEKYGHCGTVFATAGKLETAAGLRPTLADVWSGRIPPEGLPRVDAPFVKHRLGFDERHDLFLNWDEARHAESTGTLAVAAHSMWHRSVFTSASYEGFYAPQRRGRTFDRVEGDVPWGLPRFKVGPALRERAFLPSAELLHAIHETVPQDKDGAYAFFSDTAATERLMHTVEAFGADGLGRFETDAERTERMYREMRGCKQLLESELGHPVTTFCWPWGAFCDEALAIGRELGFRVFLTTLMGSNPPSAPLAVNRFKAKAKPWSWLRLRLHVYSRPLIANLYAKMRL